MKDNLKALWLKIVPENLQPKHYESMSNEFGISPSHVKAIVTHYNEDITPSEMEVVERAAQHAWREHSGWDYKLWLIAVIMTVIVLTIALTIFWLRIWVNIYWKL